MSVRDSWRECRLGDVVELKRGYDLPQQQRRDGVVPIVSSSGPTGFHSEAMARAPGVVTGRYGTIGQVFYVEQDFWPLNTTLYVRDFKGNDPKFVSYFLRTVDFYSCSDKAAVPGVNRNDLHRLSVALPPLPEQRAIAHVLGTLDDKIELNRKMSETLEELARTLFKSWFVDFDPVHAKAAGKKPFGMDDATAALFPDSFEDSELGPIPRGWRVATLGEIATVRYGRPFASNRFNTEGRGLPLLRIRDLRRGECSVFTDEAHSESDLVTPGAVVAGMDGEFRTHLWTGDTCLLNQRVCRFDASDDAMPTAFIYNAVRPRLVEFERFKTGTTVIHLSKTDIDSIRIVVPPAEMMSSYASLTSGMTDRFLLCHQESRTLAELRDTLLPKLLSGELRVPLDVVDAPTTKSEQLGLFGER